MIKKGRCDIRIVAFFYIFLFVPIISYALPMPKEGLLISKDQADEIRSKVIGLGDHQAMKKVKDKAEKALLQWTKDKPEIERYVDKLLDVWWESNPKEYIPEDAISTSKLLGEAMDNTSSMAFIYFLTGENSYAEACYEIIEMAGRVPRWGWFNWDGANMPQIHYGILTRNIAVAIDWCWDGWNERQRKKAIEIIAEKGVESYWRLVNHTPFMAYHHLRSKNQGNNALSAAIMASLVVGDNIPENKVWLETLIGSFSWIVTHDIGYAGQNLESGLPGYWSISMQNLYTAASAIYNAKGIDFRVHIGFTEATYYPIYHEATIPPVEEGKPVEIIYGSSSLIDGTPIELPHKHTGSSWWFDYAKNFPDSLANYFVSKIWDTDIEDAHQAGLSDILKILWVALSEKPNNIKYPTALFGTTDRMAMFRSGYGSPHTYLYFNSNVFLSSRNEILCATSGHSWHFPWHQYAIAESVLETEGQPFSPSMLIYAYYDRDFISMIRSKSWTSNIKYYKKREQEESYKQYKVRNRDIIYVRSDDWNSISDYFLFIDRVEHDKPAWHSFNWHLWNSPGNEGSYEIISPNTVIGRRPNADVLLVTLSHNTMGYETQGIPSQPNANYQLDHNALLLRAIAGGMTEVSESPQSISADLWTEGKTIEIDGRTAKHLPSFKDLRPSLESPIRLTKDVRYKVSIYAKKRNAKVYENFAWTINIFLLDDDGNVVRMVNVGDREPDPLRLTDTASFRSDYDWLESVTYFDAPSDVTRIKMELLPATWGHSPYDLKPDSELWLSDILITPLGIPKRTEKDRLVTLVMPMEKDSKIPRIIVRNTSQGLQATVEHQNGTNDVISIDNNDVVRIIRRSLVGIKRFAGVTMPVQFCTNSLENQVQLKKGLSKLTQEVLKERDKYVLKGWDNIALYAEVTASATRDQRFSPKRVIDNKTWEFPADGILDYTIGEIQTTQGFGYGKNEKMSYTENMSSLPFNIPPTYWLLPYRQTGDITLKLKIPSKLRLVRILNTSNAGLYDYGTIDFRLELLDKNQKPVYTKSGSFGKVWDHAFRSAFAMPEFFNSYGPTFDGLLTKGAKLPFGSGWQDINIEYSGIVHYVRIVILSYWGLGGGLNEVQVYAKD